ncbi:MAG: hypothetical protein ACT4NY_34105 [Pseudonocardiales bacterium]
MSSLDDNVNGAEQTRSYPNPPEECGRAVRLVCSYAHNADDAWELLMALGLNPRDGRLALPPQTTRPGSSSCGSG